LPVLLFFELQRPESALNGSNSPVPDLELIVQGTLNEMIPLGITRHPNAFVASDKICSARILALFAGIG